MFSVLVLEPIGTDRYIALFRTLRLPGYGLCVLLSFLLVHGLTRWWVEQNVRVWRLSHELLALTRRAIIALLGQHPGEERVVLMGRNQDDRIRLAPSDFVCAVAEQNYVTIH